MNVITKSVQLPDGRTITIETGKVAKQADGAAVLRMNNTVLLATVTAAKEAVPGTDFMPVTVDYREKYYATGRFPGGFTKREGKASDEEILTSRLVDRALRPLFPSDYHSEVFVQIMLLSSDGVDQPDALAGFAASAAMACSTIPFEHTLPMPVPHALEKASLADQRPAKYSIFRLPESSSKRSHSFSVKTFFAKRACFS